MGVGDDLRPERLGVAGEDGVGVLRDLVRDQGRVHPAHHHRDAPGAVLGGDLVRTAGRERLDGDRHEVGRLVVVDSVDPVVEELDVHAGGRQAGQERELEGLHPGCVDEGRAVREAPEGGLDERDSHAPAPLSAPPSCRHGGVASHDDGRAGRGPQGPVDPSHPAGPPRDARRPRRRTARSAARVIHQAMPERIDRQGPGRARKGVLLHTPRGAGMIRLLGAEPDDVAGSELAEARHLGSRDDPEHGIAAHGGSVHEDDDRLPIGGQLDGTRARGRGRRSRGPPAVACPRGGGPCGRWPARSARSRRRTRRGGRRRGGAGRGRARRGPDPLRRPGAAAASDGHESPAPARSPRRTGVRTSPARRARPSTPPSAAVAYVEADPRTRLAATPPASAR